MAISYTGNLARFSGDCVVEEALEFSEWARERAICSVDLSECTHMHAALLQCFLAMKLSIAARPADPFLAGALAGLPDAATGPAGAPRPAKRTRRKTTVKENSIEGQP